MCRDCGPSSPMSKGSGSVSVSVCGCDPKSKGNKTPTKKSIDKQFRDYIARTNIDLFVIAFLLAWYHAGMAFAETATESHATHVALSSDSLFDNGNDDSGHGESSHEATTHGESLEHEQEEETEEVLAVLFPWFVQIIGVFVYYVLSRYCHALPYTACLFIVGFFMGFSEGNENVNAVIESTSIWLGINGEVILLVFLPGLLYLDSYNIDVYLFIQSFWQLITFAFPMVLGGTALTALVAYYIFPYGWSFDLSMTFGAILAATDPVAVAVLLNELGAPPRLKMHISGESLMNDGSAVVFYNIFVARFLYELGLPGVGEDIGWGEGFKLFFRLSFGGAAIGIAFGIGTVFMLFHLNRRISGEDNLVQVVLTISSAYLVFFTSEILAHCSGILAVMFCGLTVKAFGETLINDHHLNHSFWHITEHLLNTLLFGLAGCVWGGVIHNVGFTEEVESAFEGKDWGYLFLLYVLLTAIRFFLIFLFYPLTKNIGIGTNWKESLFAAYGGLRGAVGIALALSLHAECVHLTSVNEVDPAVRDQYRHYTAKLFGFVGGIALLTLVINATTCGPLLKKLGLVTPTETREKIVKLHNHHMVQYTLVEYIKLMAEDRFQNVDFAVIREHVSFFQDISYEQLLSAVRKYKENTLPKKYAEPNLEHVVPYLYDIDIIHEESLRKVVDTAEEQVRRTQLMNGRKKSAANLKAKRSNRKNTVFDLSKGPGDAFVHEERHIFIQILRTQYHRMIDHGELESRGFIPHSLFQSLDFAEDAAAKGLPLNDWDGLMAVSNSWATPAEKALQTLFQWKKILKREVHFDFEFLDVYIPVRQALVFIRAHECAREIFKEEFASIGADSLSSTEKIVLDESKKQVQMAYEVINVFDLSDVQSIKSHYVCQILLSKSAYYFEKLAKRGLVSAREASEFHEEIEHKIFHVLQCRKLAHDDELTGEYKETKFRSLPDYMLTDLKGGGPTEKPMERAGTLDTGLSAITEDDLDLSDDIIETAV